MKKIFTKSQTMYMGVALLISIIVVFLLQTWLTSSNNTKSAIEKLETVAEKLDSNDKEIERLTQNVGENNLAKSRAFADLLAEDPEIVGNEERLNEICNRLMVNELHIIDDKGIIVSSTVPAYIGFDMGSGEQSAAFLVILNDPEIEIVQEPMMNAAEGKVTQYIGVARKDAPGFVQVGIEPEVMTQALASTAVDVVLKEFDYGTEGYVWAVNKSDGTVAAHKNESLVGRSAAEVGLPIYAGQGKTKSDGISGYYVAQERGDLIIGTFLPSGEYYSSRIFQTGLISIDLIIVFIALLVLINRLVDRQIISGVKRIEADLSKIAEGDFSVTVEERSNPEFAALSENINRMVLNTKTHIGENEDLVSKQKDDMDKTLQVVESVRDACENLEEMSQKTLQAADEISNGAMEQKDAIRALESVMETLKDRIYHSADETAGVTEATEVARHKIKATESRMTELVESIENITGISRQIETIIDEINGIASQTNLLALNASIEAARAGDAGRGFAVVATEVGGLATSTSQSAQQTTELINRSISAVAEGRKLAEDTSKIFADVVESIQVIDTAAENIATVVRSNVEILSEAVLKIEDIESVLDANVEISGNSKELSENMAGVTERLMEIVNRI